jgi:tRNA(fMet)-specific endonuclease VapC
MKYVLDTNTLSFLMKGQPTAVKALSALKPRDVLVPQPVLAEVEYGLARLPQSRRRMSLVSRFRLFSQEVGRAEWTDDVSSAFGALKARLHRRGVPLEDMDIAVAAHAIALDATLVSSDHSHISRIRGLRLTSWA